MSNTEGTIEVKVTNSDGDEVRTIGIDIDTMKSAGYCPSSILFECGNMLEELGVV